MCNHNKEALTVVTTVVSHRLTASAQNSVDLGSVSTLKK